MEFVNGKISWMETHFEVVSRIQVALQGTDNKVVTVNEERGTGGLYELAEELTDAFEEKYLGRVWDGDFFDEIEYFLDHNLQYF